MPQTLRRPRFFFVAAFVVLAAVDFSYFLYSWSLSSALAALVFVFLAVGWNWWFRRLAEEDRVTTLNLGTPRKLNHD
jgi:membrane protein implicated in regulation of membrane protease activity